MPDSLLNWFENFSVNNKTNVDEFICDTDLCQKNILSIAECKGFVNDLDYKWCDFLKLVREQYSSLLPCAIETALEDLQHRLADTEEASKVMGPAPFLKEQAKEMQMYIDGIEQLKLTIS